MEKSQDLGQRLLDLALQGPQRHQRIHALPTQKAGSGPEALPEQQRIAAEPEADPKVPETCLKAKCLPAQAVLEPETGAEPVRDTKVTRLIGEILT